MRHRKISSAEADMTPLLDIVFILLIFFVVTATFLKEQAMDMTPPPASGHSAITSPAILVSISPEGLVRVNGALSDIEMVRAKIERELAQLPDQSVIVQAASVAKNGLVIRAVDQARSAGVQSIGFMVAEPG